MAVGTYILAIILLQILHRIPGPARSNAFLMNKLFLAQRHTCLWKQGYGSLSPGSSNANLVSP